MKSAQLMDLPTKRITYKNGSNGTKYMYYTVRSYRNVQGKPTSDEKSIGKLDEATGLLIPNKKIALAYYQANAKTTRKLLNQWGILKSLVA